MKDKRITICVFKVLCLLLWLLCGCKPKVGDLSRTREDGEVLSLLPAPMIATLPATSLTQSWNATETVIDPAKANKPEIEPNFSAAEDTIAAEETVSVQDYPESHYIQGIAGHSQYYYLSCESSAAVDWAWFFKVQIYESTFQVDMPRSDNPDYGYVGDFTTRIWGQIPPYSYGVHAGPIAEALRAYDLPAKAVKNYTLDEVKQMLSADKPIIAWVIGNMEYSEAVEYVDKEGRVSIVAPHEHVVILTGYDEESIRYMNNGKFYEVPVDVFLTSWGVLGNMAVVYEEKPSSSSRNE